MKEDIQLKLQAYLDGELPAQDAKAVTELLASDGEARALLMELTNTRNAITAHEAEIKVPANREFTGQESAVKLSVQRKRRQLRLRKYRSLPRSGACSCRPAAWRRSCWL